MREPTESKGLTKGVWGLILRIRGLQSQVGSSLLFPPCREMFHSSQGYGDPRKRRWRERQREKKKNKKASGIPYLSVWFPVLCRTHQAYQTNKLPQETETLDNLRMAMCLVPTGGVRAQEPVLLLSNKLYGSYWIEWYNLPTTPLLVHTRGILF